MRTNFLKNSNIFNFYESFDILTTCAYCKKVWFLFLNGVVLPGVWKDHFYRSVPRSVNTSITWSKYWPVNRWTGQYPILAYTTWRDLNQSQPHISIRGITIRPTEGPRNKTVGNWPVAEAANSASGRNCMSDNISYSAILRRLST